HLGSPVWFLLRSLFLPDNGSLPGLMPIIRRQHGMRKRPSAVLDLKEGSGREPSTCCSNCRPAKSWSSTTKAHQSVAMPAPGKLPNMLVNLPPTKKSSGTVARQSAGSGFTSLLPEWWFDVANEKVTSK